MKMRNTKNKMRKKQNEKADRQTLIREPEPVNLIHELDFFKILEPDSKARKFSNTRKIRPEPENPEPSPKCLAV